MRDYCTPRVMTPLGTDDLSANDPTTTSYATRLPAYRKKVSLRHPYQCPMFEFFQFLFEDSKVLRSDSLLDHIMALGSEHFLRGGKHATNTCRAVLVSRVVALRRAGLRKIPHRCTSSSLRVLSTKPFITAGRTPTLNLQHVPCSVLPARTHINP